MNINSEAAASEQHTAVAAVSALIPQPAARKGIRSLGTELYYLLRIQYAEVRETWIWVVLLASLFPFSTLLFMKFFLESPSPDVMMRIVSGNIIFPIIIMSINGLGNHISWSKQQGHFTFYASLPISKINFLLAFIIRGFLMTLPSVIIMTVVGHFVFHVDIHLNLGLIPIVLLAISGSAGFGTLIGFLTPNQDMTTMITNLLMVFLNFLTPVMIDIHQLPSVLQVVSYFFPTTYAADGLKHLLQGVWSSSVTIDMLALLAFTCLSVWIVVKKMDWRLE
ncbi:ABC transporter permease [Paenibacillus zeisoli]|uniref:Transport permease protein n=1 Tax=Paenibacillus zeisoli TaxID=2496267 RepID=A0A3S1E2L8_9BACL|nr:ABC transporter permease [Paenibacillus zeisoli]RUT36529.1 ABC transporter permease [Paenibacillus zeisoli]